MNTPDKHIGMLAVSSNKSDVAGGKRRIRICGVIVVPDDFPETEMDWEKWLAEVTIEPIKKFTPRHPIGDCNNAILSLGPDSLGSWEEKE